METILSDIEVIEKITNGEAEALRAQKESFYPKEFSGDLIFEMRQRMNVTEIVVEGSSWGALTFDTLPSLVNLAARAFGLHRPSFFPDRRAHTVKLADSLLTKHAKEAKPVAAAAAEVHGDMLVEEVPAAEPAVSSRVQYIYSCVTS
jgi:hypothetical protein